MSRLFHLKKITDLFNKVSVFYNLNSANYWHTVTRCRITSRPDETGPYFLDFSSKSNYVQKIDPGGVPLFEYEGEIKETYHPVVICQYALGLFDVYFESGMSNNEIKKKFLAQADWLCKNAFLKDTRAYWHFDYPDIRYGIKPPWFSAMAQGEAISVLCRAFKITGKEEYLKIAEAAQLMFSNSINDGGVRRLFKGNVIFEEYPADKVTGVLNGFMFALFGLYDLYLANKNNKALSFFNEGVSNLKTLLNYYDLGYWSRYDLFKFPLVNPASFTYHELHIEQLKVLYILTNEKIFLDYSLKWKNYESGYFKKTRALINKIIYLKKINAI